MSQRLHCALRGSLLRFALLIEKIRHQAGGYNRAAANELNHRAFFRCILSDGAAQCAGHEQPCQNHFEFHDSVPSQFTGCQEPGMQV